MSVAAVERAPVILSADKWRDNGKLIAHIAQLGYLRLTDHTLDPTFEKGNWWTDFRPDRLTTHVRAVDGSDFRALPYADSYFDAIAYDPPYCCPGGLKTSGIKEMHGSYGMGEDGDEQEDERLFRSPRELQDMINGGLTEMMRLVKPSRRRAMSPEGSNGVVIVKCMNYIWSGQLWLGAHYTLAHALELGFWVEDLFTHVGSAGPQPERTRKHAPCKGQGCADCANGRIVSGQAHSRQNASVAYVLRAPRIKPGLLAA